MICKHPMSVFVVRGVPVSKYQTEVVREVEADTAQAAIKLVKRALDKRMLDAPPRCRWTAEPKAES